MATEGMARLFTALWPDDALRQRMIAQREGWWLPKSAQLVRADRLHLTLHFIGDADRSRVKSLRGALREVAVEPFEMLLDVAEAWRSGVASYQPGTVPAALARLHRAVGAALGVTGGDVEHRAWRPHVTLARRADAARAPSEPFALRWWVDSFVLVESDLSPPARYDVIERYPV